LRSLRSLAVAHQLGHKLMSEGDTQVSLLARLIEHAGTTARFNVFYGEKRDVYDVRGRTAHESIFNLNDGQYRCPNSQQGYSPFSTWTRGLAWAILGFAEELEFLNALPDDALPPMQKGQAPVAHTWQNAAEATADFYLQNCCSDGVPVWDTGAPNLHRMGDYQKKPADPYNMWEPVDSSAAVIAAQGLIRLGNYLASGGAREKAARYRQAGLTLASTLFDEPYLSTAPHHQGLILHSVYHRPRGWDYIAPGQKVPNGESSMWGDYHARELALLLLREAQGIAYPTFFGSRPALAAPNTRSPGHD
jgi:unsaturated chondroitin disaccharide hydrolase